MIYMVPSLPKGKMGQPPWALYEADRIRQAVWLVEKPATLSPLGVVTLHRLDTANVLCCRSRVCFWIASVPSPLCPKFTA